MKWLTPVKPEKNACPESALFQCSLVRSDAADAAAAAADEECVARAAADHSIADLQIYLVGLLLKLLFRVCFSLQLSQFCAPGKYNLSQCIFWTLNWGCHIY